MKTISSAFFIKYRIVVKVNAASGVDLAGKS